MLIGIDDPQSLVLWAEDHRLIDGTVSRTDLSRVDDIEFPDISDANTMNGLIIKRLNRMPQHDQIEDGGLR